MEPENSLEKRCRKAIIRMADDVKDINYKLTHFLEISESGNRNPSYSYRSKIPATENIKEPVDSLCEDDSNRFKDDYYMAMDD